MLASDGFWELIDEDEMVRCFKKADNVHTWMNQMEKIVIQNGQGKDMDNYSAIGVWIR